jgi:hypothetical protein
VKRTATTNSKLTYRLDRMKRSEQRELLRWIRNRMQSCQPFANALGRALDLPV